MGGGRSWLSYDAASQRILLTVRVQPGAQRNKIIGLQGEALKIKIAAPPVDNKANAALIDFLSETLRIPRSAIIIRRGTSSRSKVLEIAGSPALAARLEALAGRSTTHDPRPTPSTSK
ncbi:MAG: DUF167 domain-containing protein [Burkholderiales bacterium]